jgi:deoxyguanosine kinase
MLRYIAIEGAIGAGKTTLARRLGAHFGAELLLEKPADNPFLARFYRAPSRYALATQMTFLFERVDQCRAALQSGLFSAQIVADFLFEKDPLFAKITLSDSEYALYAKVFEYLQPEAAVPDCVIYLRASVPLLQARIGLRGIDMERAITDAYLQRLNDEYTAFFARYTAAPVITIDVARFTPATNDAHFAQLLRALERCDESRTVEGSFAALHSSLPQN